jgi:uncharacterized protein YndB with AHSA1/START domain
MNYKKEKKMSETTKSAVTDSATDKLVITRVFNAPRELIWRAFTEEDRLAQWWGPKGFKMITSKADLRPGGIYHYGMQSPDGQEMYGRFVYGEIVPPERISFVVSFSDKDAGITRAPFSPTWPLEVLNVLTLSENDGKTTLTLRGGPVNASPEELDTFRNGRASMNQGFKGTFDQLEEYLAKG